MIGDRIGTFKGYDVYRIYDMRSWEMADTNKDEVIYWVGERLMYKDRVIAHITSTGNVYDFNQELFSILEKTEELPQHEEKEEMPVATETESSFTDEKTPVNQSEIPSSDNEVSSFLNLATKSIEDLLEDFPMSANDYLVGVEKL